MNRIIRKMGNKVTAEVEHVQTESNGPAPSLGPMPVPVQQRRMLLDLEQQMITHSEEDVTFEQPKRDRKPPTPFSGTKNANEIFPLDVWSVVLRHVFSSDLKSVRLVSTQLLQLADKHLKTRTIKKRRNEFCTVSPVGRFSKDFACFGIGMLSTGELIVCQKSTYYASNIVAWNPKTKAVRTLIHHATSEATAGHQIVTSYTCIEHLAALPSGGIVVIKRASEEDSHDHSLMCFFTIEVYESKRSSASDDQHYAIAAKLKLEEKVPASDTRRLKRNYAVGGSVVAIADLGINALDLFRFDNTKNTVVPIGRLGEMALLLHVTPKDEIVIGYDRSLEDGAPQILEGYNCEKRRLWRVELKAPLFRYFSASLEVDDDQNFYITNSHSVQIWNRNGVLVRKIPTDRMMKREPKITFLTMRSDGDVLICYDDGAVFAITDE